MKYMMLIAGSEDGWRRSEEEQAHYGRIGELVGRAGGRGPHRRGPRARAVLDGHHGAHRRRTARPTVTDGPFAEGKEMVGGYGILEVPDLDAALRSRRGGRCPATPRGPPDRRA